MITKSGEEYLKNIYIIKKQEGTVRVTDIANKMNCTKPSVNKALHCLKDNGLVNYETYGTIELTPDGESLSKKILEAYDIVYLFLTDVLNMDEKKAKSEADIIKQNMSDDTLNALAKYVHKELGLGNLNCSYNINNELCRSCIKREKVRNNIF